MFSWFKIKAYDGETWATVQEDTKTLGPMPEALANCLSCYHGLMVLRRMGLDWAAVRIQSSCQLMVDLLTGITLTDNPSLLNAAQKIWKAREPFHNFAIVYAEQMD